MFVSVIWEYPFVVQLKIVSYMQFFSLVVSCHIEKNKWTATIFFCKRGMTLTVILQDLDLELANSVGIS